MEQRGETYHILTFKLKKYLRRRLSFNNNRIDPKQLNHD